MKYNISIKISWGKSLMKPRVQEKLIEMGVFILVFIICVLIYFSVSRYSALCQKVSNFIGIISPFIYGVAIAYVLAPVTGFYKRLINRISKDKSKIKISDKFADRLGILLSYISLVLLFVLFMSFVMPQIIESIQGLIEKFPVWVVKIDMQIKKLLSSNPNTPKQMVDLTANGYENAINYVKNMLINNVQPILTTLSDSIWEVVVFFKNLIIGIIVSIYMLCNRAKLKAQAKKIIYAVLKKNAAEITLTELRFVDRSFGGFIVAKLIDSLIIGIMAYIILLMMHMPYVALLSVIIGVTNIIPFFGPFIGAIPCFVLVVLTDPLKGLYFLVFVFLLQQFDGNVLGPKLLGAKVGISGLWVIFSILVFGSYWGITGMIIGVPLFAVIYDLVAKSVNYLLRKKGMSTRTDDYK